MQTYRKRSEIDTEAPWLQLVDVFKRLKPVRYTSEGETIVQAIRIGPELTAIMKRLTVSRPKPVLAIG